MNGNCEKNWVTDIKSFLDKLPNQTKGIFYRGHSDSNYDLIPSVFRKKIKMHESEIFNRAITECSKEFEGMSSHADILSKMQHFDIPTRLLDITSNPLVALYFACGGRSDTNGAVHIMECNEIFPYDSDRVSLLARLPRFNCEEQCNIIQAIEEYKKCPGRKEREMFNEKDVIIRLLHEVRKEKPAFKPAIIPEHFQHNYFYAPKKTTERIIRQSGAFVIFGLGDNKLEKEKKIIVGASSKESIRNELLRLGISMIFLFPELYKLGEYINNEDGLQLPVGCQGVCPF